MRSKPPNSNTVREIVAQYEAERMPSRHTTARTYRSLFINHILPRWGGLPIGDLKPRPVELWLATLPLSPKSKTHVRSLLFGLVEYAMWAGTLEIARNPISLVRNKGALRKTRKARSLTPTEFHALHAKLAEPFATIALLCVCLGLRISEALALKWADVDWVDGRLSIERGIVSQVVADVKTIGSAKSLKLPRELLNRLGEHKQKSKLTDPTHWIFASPVKGGRLPYSYTGFSRILRRAATDAGVGHLASHTFRHTYRSWLDAVGTPVAVQQKMMRHADIRTTFNIYGDVITDEMAVACAKVTHLAL